MDLKLDLKNVIATTLLFAMLAALAAAFYTLGSADRNLATRLRPRSPEPVMITCPRCRCTFQGILSPDPLRDMTGQAIGEVVPKP